MIELARDAIFAENLALTSFLGMCTWLAVSKRVATAAGLGVCMIVVLTLTVPLNGWLQSTLLAPGALAGIGLESIDLSFLGLLVSIGTIAATVQVLERLLYRHAPALFDAMGIFLPLITVNCAILGASLFAVERDYGFTENVVYGFASGVGWALAVVLFAALRERARFARVPRGLDGLGLAFLITGLLSLGFAGIAST